MGYCMTALYRNLDLTLIPHSFFTTEAVRVQQSWRGCVGFESLIRFGGTTYCFGCRHVMGAQVRLLGCEPKLTDRLRSFVQNAPPNNRVSAAHCRVTSLVVIPSRVCPKRECCPKCYREQPRCLLGVSHRTPRDDAKGKNRSL